MELVYQYSGVTFGYELTTHSDVQTVGEQMPSKHHERAVLQKVTHTHRSEAKWKKQVMDYLNRQVPF